VRTFGLCQCFKPVGDFVVAFLARSAGHTRVHIGVLMGLAGDCSLEIVRGGADRQASGRVTGFFEVLQVAMSVAGLAFSGGAENGGDVVVAFNIGALRKIQVTAVGL